MKKSLLIAFYSPFQGQAGQSTSMAALGAYIGINYNLKTLLMHSQPMRSSLENAFLASKKDSIALLFDDKGIHAVEKLARTKQLSEKNLTDYTTTLIPGRLELLTEMSHSCNQAKDYTAGIMPYILACAKQAFDLVLCDVDSPKYSILSDILLNNADFIIVNLNQSLEVLRSYFDRQVINPAVREKNHALLLGNFDSNSKYTVKTIKRLFHYNSDIYQLPHSTILMDSCNDHSLLRFLYANSQIRSNDDNFPLMKSLSNTSERIIQELQTNSEILKKPLKQQSILEILKIFTRKV
jgi:hypothetical protein